MNLNENINRIKSVMGLNESVLEGEDELNRLLDKIGEVGYDGLSNKEKVFLHQYSKDEPVREKPTSWNYFINVSHPQIGNLEMAKKFIKHVLDKNNIDCEITTTNAFLYIFIQVLIQHEFQFEKAINILSDKGFQIFDNGSVEQNSVSTGKYVHDKINKIKSAPAGILFRPNHGHELTGGQESKRINKILSSIDYFGGYSMVSDGTTYDIRLKKPESKDVVINVLNNNGYKIIG